LDFFEPVPSAASSPAHQQSAASNSQLIALINGGGEQARSAAAIFLKRHEGAIRRRLRRKIAAATSRIFDTEDLFSTVARRIDQEVEQQRLSTLNEQQLWGLINRIAENCVTDVARAERPRRTAIRGPLRFDMHRLRREAQDKPGLSGGDVIEKARQAIPQDDRQLLGLWLLGAPFTGIAAALGLTETGARKRWERLRRSLREQLPRDSL
jgi:DNA-directed RNA polymerase specialized sigma24 family protein